MLCCSAMFRLLMNLDTKTTTTTTHVSWSSIQCVSIQIFSPPLLLSLHLFYSSFVTRHLLRRIFGRIWLVLGILFITRCAYLLVMQRCGARRRVCGGRLQLCGARHRVCGGRCRVAEPATTTGFSFPRGLINPNNTESESKHRANK